MKKKRHKTISVALLVSGLLFLGSIIIFVAKTLYLERTAYDKEVTAAQIIVTVRNCQTSYSNKHQGKFAKSFKDLAKTGCIDEDHFSDDSPIFNDFIFSMKANEPTGTKPAFYSVNADPQELDNFYSDELRHFYFDSTLGAIKVTKEKRQAKASDPLM